MYIVIELHTLEIVMFHWLTGSNGLQCSVKSGLRFYRSMHSMSHGPFIKKCHEWKIKWTCHSLFVNLHALNFTAWLNCGTSLCSSAVLNLCSLCDLEFGSGGWQLIFNVQPVIPFRIKYLNGVDGWFLEWKHFTELLTQFLSAAILRYRHHLFGSTACDMVLQHYRKCLRGNNNQKFRFIK